MRKEIFESEEKVVREFATKFTESVKFSNLDSKIKSLLYIYIEDFTDLYVENQLGLIRKSPLEEAREKTDNLLNKIKENKLWCNEELFDYIQTERELADAKL